MVGGKGARWAKGSFLRRKHASTLVAPNCHNTLAHACVKSANTHMHTCVCAHTHTHTHTHMQTHTLSSSCEFALQAGKRLTAVSGLH